MTEAKKTKAEQLDAIMAKVAPASLAYYREHGKWPLPAGVTGPEHLRTAPYLIRTLKDGRKQVRIQSEDGDTLAGTGKTTEDAVAALAAKIRL